MAASLEVSQLEQWVSCESVACQEGHTEAEEDTALEAVTR
jgi:hypothetical protein